MPLIFALEPIYIALIAIGALALLGVFILLYFTFFRLLAFRKMAKELVATFEKHHAILEGEIQQFYARLERISQLNLIYAAQAGEWKRRLSHFREGLDAKAYSCSNLLREEIERGSRKELKRDLPAAKETITTHAAQVDELYNELRNLLQGEEVGRESLLKTRAALRDVKKSFYNQKDNCEMLIEPFEKVFRALEDLLGEAETKIDSANYEDASSTLQKEVLPVIKEMEKAIPDLPKLCLEVNRILPERFISLRASFENLNAMGYPLQHLVSRHDLEVLEKEIALIREKLLNLSFAGVEKECEEIEKRMSQLQANFQNEQDAKSTFDATIEGAYNLESELSSDFINLCHALPRVREIYLLDEEDQAKIDAIQNIVNQSGASKRLLDTCIHNAVKQPYSVLLSNEKNLQDQVKSGREAIQDFRNYLASLKEDAEADIALLPKEAKSLQEVEIALREMHNDKLSNKYADDIEHLHSLLDELSTTLSTTPIDVKKANSLKAKLAEKGDKLYQEVSKAYQNEKEASMRLLKANAFRNDSPEIENILLQSEALYEAGEFAEASSLAEEVEEHSAAKEGRN